MKVKFWGVHGSVPVPGPSTLKYGGNTSCVELDCGGEIIILDGGTGLRPLGLDLIERGFCTESGRNKTHIFFSHVHWDHIQGLPFFRPAFVEGFEINLYGALHSDVDIECSLRGQMMAPHFPLRLRDMTATINFTGINSDEVINIGEVSVSNIELNHPNGAFGYKIVSENKSVVYLSDHEYSEESNPRLIEFARNANLVVYDAQYTPEEYYSLHEQARRKGWGHGTWKNAVEFSREANIEQLVLFHHEGNDQKVSEIESLAKKEFENTISAYEGLEITIT